MITHHLATPQNPQRVVVLGGSGFVGRAIVRQLAARQLDHLSLASCDLDLCQAEAVEQLAHILKPTDALVFVSALAPSRGRDIATLMRNLSMAQNVCQAIEKARCDHVVYIGSDAVYSDNDALIRSDSPCHPASYHGVMHLAREVMLTTTLQKPGIPLALLRPSVIYGASDPHNSYGPNRFVRTARKDGKIALFGGGEEQRDHIHVDDVARIVVEALRHRSSGVLNVATGKSVSFFDAATIVARLVGKRVEIVPSPRANPITHRHFDVSDRLRAFPNVQPVDLETGLRQMLAEEK